MSKERLTEKTKDCFGYRLKDGSDAEVGFFKNYDAFYSHMMVVKALGEYEDLEEQGLLLRLPCKLGDDLYWISSEDEDGNEKPTICKIENGITHITITENDIWVNAEGEAPTELDVLGGEYALLTYAEAEEKLRELNEESEEQPMNCVCGNCKYNKRDFSKPQNSGYAEFCCGNEDSNNYGVPTMYDDSCDDFEEKE